MEQEIKDIKNTIREHQHNNVDGTLSLSKSTFITVNLYSTTAQTTTNYGLIFTATRPCFIKAISEKHTIAGNDAGAVTLQIERLQSTTTLTNGTDLLSTAFNLKGTAYTTQRGALIRQPALNLSDSLALVLTGTPTTLEGVQVTIEIEFI